MAREERGEDDIVDKGVPSPHTMVLKNVGGKKPGNYTEQAGSRGLERDNCGGGLSKMVVMATVACRRGCAHRRWWSTAVGRV